MNLQRGAVPTKAKLRLDIDQLLIFFLLAVTIDQAGYWLGAFAPGGWGLIDKKDNACYNIRAEGHGSFCFTIERLQAKSWVSAINGPDPQQVRTVANAQDFAFVAR